jgi:sec-independent protein translocase protein TatA
MNVFGIGLPEMAVIAAIALLVFGPKRLPELGKTLGRTLKGFQSASQGFEEQFRTALDATPESSQSQAAATTTAAAEVGTATVAISTATEASSPSGASAS